MTLAILAAGMGSRYGGLKQIDPMTDNGEFIIDFSIYDAIRAGFDKVVFIIKEENLQDFKETIGDRIAGHIKVEYAFQNSSDIPEFAKVNPERVKPWGTSHAIYAARNIIHEPFAVINADDFYGRDAFEKLAKHLSSCRDSGDNCMVGYILRNTLTEHGTVSRGRCETTNDGYLASVTELTKIACNGNDAKYLDGNGEWVGLSGDTIVSMNCWGFTADAMDGFGKDLNEFFASGRGSELKSECFLPGSVDKMMKAGVCTVKVYGTSASWFGVTYPEDKEYVKASVRKLIDAGEYPENLWN